MALTYRRRFEGACEVDSEVGCEDEVVDLVESESQQRGAELHSVPTPPTDADYAGCSSGDCGEPGAETHPWTLPWYEDQLRTHPPARSATRQIKVIHQGVGYSSLSEAACGALLELLVPGFRVQEGVTYQIPFGKERTVDFLVEGVLFEYHPPRLVAERRGFGDFRSPKEYDRFQQLYKKARYDKRKREALLNSTIHALGEEYYRRRRIQLDEDERFRNTELVVATGIPELYEKIVLRFGRSAAPLSAEQFTNLFFAFVKSIARQNSRRGFLPRRRGRSQSASHRDRHKLRSRTSHRTRRFSR